MPRPSNLETTICFIYLLIHSISISWRPTDEFSLIRILSILALLLNTILFQASASYHSYIFDQLNIAFKCILVKASFLAVMHPFNFFSKDLVSTVNKLHNLHSSITCLAVFFGWVFSVQICFHTILYDSFWWQPHLGWSETLPVLWNFERISEMPLLEISSFFAIAH